MIWYLWWSTCSLSKYEFWYPGHERSRFLQYMPNCPMLQRIFQATANSDQNILFTHNFKVGGRDGHISWMLDNSEKNNRRRVWLKLPKLHPRNRAIHVDRKHTRRNIGPRSLQLTGNLDNTQLNCNHLSKWGFYPSLKVKSKVTIRKPIYNFIIVD